MHDMLLNHIFNNLLWKFYIETQIHKKMAIDNMDNKGINTYVTGHRGIDGRLNLDVWKIKGENIKRIIWAPHHTIEDDDEYKFSNFSSYNESVIHSKASECLVSNFIKYHKHMIQLAKDFDGKIQIAFKPHPILKRKLYGHKDWGIRKTNEYYDKWNNMDNTQLEESGYVDLFNSSDAMIFDSGSFIAEYLFCGKPSMFLVRDDNTLNVFNKFGQMALDNHYKGHELENIYNFVDMVIDGKDSKQEQRYKFYKDYMQVPNGKSASQNIYEDICNELSEEV